MTWTALAQRANQAKAIVGGVIVVGGVLFSAIGMAKVPAQQAAIATDLKDHNTESHKLTELTNKKLDVLICLQAKLDLPIRCVALGH
jgi:hypothetical protein